MRNRRASAFFNRKSYLIAAVIMVVAAFGMTGIYYSQQEKKQEAELVKEQKAQIQQAKAEDDARQKANEAANRIAEAEKKKKAQEKEKQKEKEKDRKSVV